MSKEILCRIFNKIFKVSSMASHLRVHNIKYEEYAEKNLDQFPQLKNKTCIKCGSKTTNNKLCKLCYKDSDKQVKCKHCNRQIKIKGLAHHLKTTHHILFDDYVQNSIEQFPNWHPCLICGKLTPNKTTCSGKCEGEHKKIIYKGRGLFSLISEEQKIIVGKKIGESQRKRFSIPGNSDYLKGDNNPAHRPGVGKKISETRLARGCGVGSKNPMYGKTHTPEAIKKIFSYRKMNKTEKIVADLLDQQKIPYEFQFFITDNSICKSYDFKLKDRPVIIEVDGDFWHGGPGSKTYWKDVDKVKLNDVLKESIAKTKGYKLLRFWESDLKKDVNIILQYL